MPNIRVCDICNNVLQENEIGRIWYDYLYCSACWTVHLENVRKFETGHPYEEKGELSF